MMYPVDMKIIYRNDEEYRQKLRSLANMRPQRDEGQDEEGFDTVSKDELDYDNHAMIGLLDFIKEKTKDNDDWQELFLKASYTMMVEDVDIGMVVLMSYDYLCDFHEALCYFFQNEELKEGTMKGTSCVNMSKSPSYTRLCSLFSR